MMKIFQRTYNNDNSEQQLWDDNKFVVSVIVNTTIDNFLKENGFHCVEMKALQLGSPLRPL